MAGKVSVREASEAYEGVMRNMAPRGRGVCRICWTFIDPAYPTCYRCGHQPNQLDAVVPITYSEHLGQMHTALRSYKEATGAAQRYAMVRLAAVLWRFAEVHEECVAAAAGVPAFDLVTTVPSSTPARDRARPSLRKIVGWCRPLKPRLERLLRPTSQVPAGRDYDERRYTGDPAVEGKAVLLVDDTWATGGHAQSAAHALRAAGAGSVALVVIGRHVHRERDVADGDLTSDRLDALPKQFDWETCAVYGPPG